MKKTFKKLFVLTLSVITFYSCQKNQGRITTERQTTRDDNVYKRIEIEENIKSFLSTFIHSKKTRNNAELINIIDAEKFIENGLNYEYALYQISEDTWNDHNNFEFIIENVEQNLTTIQVQNIYNQTLAILKQHKNAYLNEYNENEIQLSLLDLKFEEKNGILKVNGTDYFNLKLDIQHPRKKLVFDYAQGGWHNVNKGGFYASQFTKTFEGKFGAPEKITQYAQHNAYIPYGQVFQYGYFINVDAMILEVCQNNNLCNSNTDYTLTSPQPIINYSGTVPSTTNLYRMFYPADIGENWLYQGFGVSGYGHANQKLWASCIPDYAMNYYTDNMVNFLNVILPNTGIIPSGKGLIKNGFYLDSYSSNNGNVLYHNAVLKFGEFIVSHVNHTVQPL